MGEVVAGIAPTGACGDLGTVGWVGRSLRTTCSPLLRASSWVARLGGCTANGRSLKNSSDATTTSSTNSTAPVAKVRMVSAKLRAVSACDCQSTLGCHCVILGHDLGLASGLAVESESESPSSAFGASTCMHGVGTIVLTPAASGAAVLLQVVTMRAPPPLLLTTGVRNMVRAPAPTPLATFISVLLGAGGVHCALLGTGVRSVAMDAPLPLATGVR
mmetsp:Transcript_90993/g.262316  ORF Transcript_90993/g.262316 Transcript_90993/m.262316 type:complete len:217 (-) Transcript_90993:685-1335(-)